MSILFQKLLNNLESEAQKCSGILGLAVKDLNNNDLIEINGNELFPAASIIKIGLIIEFFNRVEKKEIEPTDLLLYKNEMRTSGSSVLKSLTEGKVSMPLIDYVTLMTTISDNSATNLLADLLGLDNINLNFQNIGLKITKLNRKMMDMELFRKGIDNITTPNEMLNLMEELYNPKILSSFVCEETLKMLKKPKEGLVQGVIRNSIKSSVQVADKSGWVGGMLGDVGIVYQPDRPYIISIFMKHVPLQDIHWHNAIVELTRITGLVHSYFEEVSSSTPEGRHRI